MANKQYYVHSGLTVAGGADITGITTVSNTTVASSTTTGALRVAGGVGIGGSVFAGNSINAITARLAFTPLLYLQNDAGGNLGNGTGIMLAARTNLYKAGLAFEDTATFGVGDLHLINNTVQDNSTATKADAKLTIKSSGVVLIPGVTQSTSTNTGALQVTGGVGVGGNIVAGGGIYAGLRADATTSGTAHQVYYNPATKEITTATLAPAGATVTISDTPPTTPSNGDLWFDSTTANLRVYYSDQDGSQWVDANSGVSSPASSFTEPYVVNDISMQFDGVTAVFELKQDQTLINNIGDSKDLEVVINGQRLAPYVLEIRYPWFTPYDSFKGFRVVGSNLIIYNPPTIGSSSYITVRSSSNTQQTRRYPFSAATIALGD